MIIIIISLHYLKTKLIWIMATICYKQITYLTEITLHLPHPNYTHNYTSLHIMVYNYTSLHIMVYNYTSF